MWGLPSRPQSPALPALSLSGSSPLREAGGSEHGRIIRVHLGHQSSKLEPLDPQVPMSPLRVCPWAPCPVTSRGAISKAPNRLPALPTVGGRTGRPGSDHFLCAVCRAVHTSNAPWKPRPPLWASAVLIVRPEASAPRLISPNSNPLEEPSTASLVGGPNAEIRKL